MTRHALTLLLPLLLGCGDANNNVDKQPNEARDSRANPAGVASLRTLPAGSDSDYDGVSDSEETSAGTDPYDSADAPAWHPEITTYPRTIFGPEDYDDVLERFQRSDDPFPTLVSRIRSSCNSTPGPYDDPDGMDQAIIGANANIARNCAFLAYIDGDSTAAAKATSILEDFPSDMGHLSMEWFDNTDIHVGEAMVSAAQAYDLLRGADLLNESSIATIESNLLGLANAAYDVYVRYFSFWYRFQNNNHKSKLSAGLGMIGMTINQNSDAARLVSYAVTEIDFVMKLQSSEQGGYAEGTYYLNYNAETVVPFFLAYHRYAEGQTLPYTQHCDTRYRFTGCEEGDVEVDDFYVDPDIHLIFEWWVGIMMPDGNAPDFDDANRRATLNGFYAGMTNNGIFRAAWEANSSSPYYSKGVEDCTVETLVVFPPELEAVWPDTTYQFLSEAGTAAFRSGWDDQARYLLLLAEHQEMVSGGHEHPDGTGVLMAAYGEYLIIDSGYGSWSQHYLVDNFENHSVVLFDGKGPTDTLFQSQNGAQTYLENCAVEEDFERCDARTSFNGIGQTRTVYFIEGERFAVLDRLEPEQSGEKHDYTALWHLNAEGDTGGTYDLSVIGAELYRPEANLSLGMDTTRGGVTVSTSIANHGPSYGTIDEHVVIEGSVEGSSVLLLTVFESRPSDEVLPTASLATGSTGVAAVKMGDGTYASLNLATEEGVTATLSSSDTGLPEVKTDADFASIRFENGELASVFYEGATVLTVGGVSRL